MELKYLYTFKTILEADNFQKAAEHLNCAQSTVTFQIRQLEEELSVKLFEKIGRQMVLTQAGKEIIPCIEQVLQSVEQLKNYGRAETELTGPLKVAMPETLLMYRMQPVLRTFREQAPNVELSIQALNCYDIRDRVIRGEFDIGEHYDVGCFGSSLVVERLSDHPLALIGSPELDPSERDFVTPGQDKKVCLITNDRNSIFQGLFDAYIKERRIGMNARLELGSIEADKQSVADNLGVAVLPAFAAKKEIDAGRVVCLETALAVDSITEVCTYHKNKWITPAMELFIRLLKGNSPKID